MATSHDLLHAIHLLRQGEMVPHMTLQDTFAFCDVCEHVKSIPVQHLPYALVNGKTTSGMWANMCPICFAEIGVGLGLGKGQVLIPPSN